MVCVHVAHDRVVPRNRTWLCVAGMQRLGEGTQHEIHSGDKARQYVEPPSLPEHDHRYGALALQVPDGSSTNRAAPPADGNIRQHSRAVDACTVSSTLTPTCSSRRRDSSVGMLINVDCPWLHDTR